MKPRLYIDTSVFGGYYDIEFEEFTKPLFDRIYNSEFVVLYSSVTQDELENAPERVAEIVKRIKTDQTEFLNESIEVIELASTYIKEKVVEKQVLQTVYI